MKEAIKRLLQWFHGVETTLAACWASSAHRRQMWVQWRLGSSAQFFDHYQDLYYQWTATRNSLWVERGVFTGLALKGGDLLELACGDGFNTKNFYSLRSRRVVACDFDPAAISLASRKNAAPNIQYVLADIRSGMPQGKFENIVWDAAIEPFTPAEIAKIMSDIKDRLASNGILSGYTLIGRKDGSSRIDQHEYEFNGTEGLARFLRPYFKNVRVFETIYPDRHNLYFWASDGIVPFDPEWAQQVR